MAIGKTNSGGGIPTSEKGVANGVATLDANGKVTASQATSLVRGITDSFTLSADLNGCCIVVNSETPITCTLPNLKTLPDNFECEVVQQSNGTVTFAVDSSVSDQYIYSLNRAVTTAGTYAVVSIKKLLPTRWLLAGALV